ncbi:MAG: GTP-binding protein [Methanosarcina sp.]
MQCIIIGGFLGSGKTTTIRKLVEKLTKQGQRTAIIVNEIGEIGIDGETLSEGGIETREITNGCVCCTLRINMEYTIRNLMASYNPDTIIIEPTGIAFPRQIKNNIESMDLAGIKFAPIANLVDASSLGSSSEDLQNFIKNQIEDAEILGINKVELINCEKLFEICLLLRKINPKAKMVHFSARQGGENFEKFLELLEKTGRKERNGDSKNSVEMSGISAYSCEYEIISRDVELEKAVSVSEQILKEITSSVKKLNPEFKGHIKLFFSHEENFVKGSVTSAFSSPEIEVFKKEAKSHSKLRVLSAVSSVPRKELIKIVNIIVTQQLQNNKLSFEKIEKSRNNCVQITPAPLKQGSF